MEAWQKLRQAWETVPVPSGHTGTGMVRISPYCIATHNLPPGSGTRKHYEFVAGEARDGFNFERPSETPRYLCENIPPSYPIRRI